MKQKQPLERRKNKDFGARLFIWMVFLAWGVLFFSLLIFHRAQPEFETFFDKFYQLTLRTHWDMKFANYVVYAIVLGLGVSIAGLGLSLFRARRKTDLKIHLKVLGILYALLFGISWFLLYNKV